MVWLLFHEVAGRLRETIALVHPALGFQLRQPVGAVKMEIFPRDLPNARASADFHSNGSEWVQM
jgi:hypothetical protein